MQAKLAEGTRRAELPWGIATIDYKNCKLLQKGNDQLIESKSFSCVVLFLESIMLLTAMVMS